MPFHPFKFLRKRREQPDVDPQPTPEPGPKPLHKKPGLGTRFIIWILEVVIRRLQG